MYNKVYSINYIDDRFTKLKSDIENLLNDFDCELKYLKDEEKKEEENELEMNYQDNKSRGVLPNLIRKTNKLVKDMEVDHGSDSSKD